MVRRLVRGLIRMVVVSAVLGAVGRIVQTILKRRAGPSGAATIRTGSFDSWPDVPSAPGGRARES